MSTQKLHKQLSKFLSLVLRHKPDTIDIELTEDGWVDTDLLIQKMNDHGKSIDIELLEEIVETNNKKRFAFNQDKSRIRANQGHSLEVNLGYTPVTPPDILYHGTAQKNIDSILQTGLTKRNRLHVHLSRDTDTALHVGQRHGKPTILIIAAKEMHAAGFEFYESENKVWLTDWIPVGYITYNDKK